MIPIRAGRGSYRRLRSTLFLILRLFLVAVIGSVRLIVYKLHLAVYCRICI